MSELVPSVRWTPDRLDKLRRLRAKGPARAQMADDFRTTPRAVENAIRQHLDNDRPPQLNRWTEDTRRLLREMRGQSAEAIALRTGMSPTSVRAEQIRLGLRPKVDRPKPWSEAEDAVLRRLAAGGADDRVIARELGRSFHAVARRRRALDIGSGVPAHGKPVPEACASFRVSLRGVDLGPSDSLLARLDARLAARGVTYRDAATSRRDPAREDAAA